MRKNNNLKELSLAELYSKYGVFLILVIALIAGACLSRAFLAPSNLLSVAKNVGVYAIMALGMTRLLIGGGVGVPPMYRLAKNLLAEGKKPIVILGFNTKDEIFYAEEFKALEIGRAHV